MKLPGLTYYPAVIIDVERLANTKNGNPRKRVTMRLAESDIRHLAVATTADDSAIAAEIGSNPGLQVGDSVEVAVVNRQIQHMVPAGTGA